MSRVISPGVLLEKLTVAVSTPPSFFSAWISNTFSNFSVDAEYSMARLPNSNLSFVYDAGHLIEAERPEALVNAVSDYVELREAFIVGRQAGIINP